MADVTVLLYRIHLMYKLLKTKWAQEWSLGTDSLNLRWKKKVSWDRKELGLVGVKWKKKKKKQRKWQTRIAGKAKLSNSNVCTTNSPYSKAEPGQIFIPLWSREVLNFLVSSGRLEDNNTQFCPSEEIFVTLIHKTIQKKVLDLECVPKLGVSHTSPLP